jgi:threonine synthase
MTLVPTGATAGANAGTVMDLRCLKCGRPVAATWDAYVCPDCGADGTDPGVLDVRYDYAAAGADFPGSRRPFRGMAPEADQGMYRYRALLPLGPALSTLPVGGTPLVPAPRLARRLGLRALYLKDDTRNPTRCFKDRATAVAVSRARASGVRDLYCASAGNAAVSLAGFCAHEGLHCHAFVPARVSATRLAWLRRYGADVRISTGDYDQAYAEAEAAGRAHGWYSRNCALNPFLVEGKKTAAYEIAEALAWRAPDLVVAPVGDGCILSSLGKGFRELALLGRTAALPRLVGVQAEGRQPLVARWAGSAAPETAAAVSGETRAASIAVRRPRNALRLLAELAHAGGRMLAVSDAALDDAARALATEAGVVVELTSAATLAGLARLAEHESLEGRTAVLVLTGGRVDEDE